MGLIMGLIIAFLLSQIYQGILPTGMHLTLNITVYSVFGFFGAVIGTKKGSEVMSQAFVKMQPKPKVTGGKSLALTMRKTEKERSECLRYWIPASSSTEGYWR